MREHSGDDRLRRLALDERHAERRVRVRPADQHRQLETIAPRLDPRRKQAEQPARARSRPHQQRADVGPEHRRRGEREVGLVEHVRLERLRGKLAPRRRDRFETGERAPFHRELMRGVTVGQHGAARAHDRRGGALDDEGRR